MIKKLLVRIMALSNADKEFIKILITSSNAKNESNINGVEIKVDGINQRLDKLNGKVGRHDEVISSAIEERFANRQHQENETIRINKELKDLNDNHYRSCPNSVLIRNLETTNITKKEMQKMVYRSLMIFSTIIGIAFIIQKMFFS